MKPGIDRALDQLTEERRFQLLVEAVRDYSIFMLDSDGFVASWNSGAEQLKGYRPGEIIGQHFSRFFTAEDRERKLPRHILERARAEGRYESEGWRVRKDGSRFWANAVVDTIRDPSGKLLGFAKVTRDITERMEAQRALMESERRFRLLVEGILDYAIYMLDPSGMVTNWNAGAERMKGYKADEIIGHHFSLFYAKEERAAGLPLRVLETARREGRYEAEGWRVRKDGSRFWAQATVDAIHDDSGQLIGFAKITRDITERRAAQEALRESERQLRLFMRSVTDYAMYMLDPNGIVVTWNPAAERIKGYTAEEIVGQHFSRFYTDHDRSAGIPGHALQRAVQDGRYEEEAWRVRKDGTLFWASAVIDPIRDDEGDLVGFAKVTRDVTERRNAEIALKEAEAQRAHAQKMDALGQLTGGVAHDFNNLLMIVAGSIRTIGKRIGDDAKGKLAVEALETAVRRGKGLTRQLLSFTRRQSLNPVTIDLAERLEALRPLLASSVAPAVKLVTAVPPGTKPVLADIGELELALINLVLNARDAMPEDGIVTITAENAAAGMPAGAEGEFVAISVADTGSGIPEDILPKVFDPFFTTKPPNKGSGLGLSQVHGFAHQSGGTVTIDTALGRGTTVTLYLPRAAKAAKTQRMAPTSLERPGSAAAERAEKGTALLVEDNPDVAQATASLVEELGYRVVAVPSAGAALEAVRQQNFELVVSDIVMAGSMDGIGLARALRESRPKLPVVLVSGYSHAALAAEPDFTVLRKPYELSELSRAVVMAATAVREPLPNNLVRLAEARKKGRPPPES